MHFLFLTVQHSIKKGLYFVVQHVLLIYSICISIKAKQMLSENNRKSYIMCTLRPTANSVLCVHVCVKLLYGVSLIRMLRGSPGRALNISGQHPLNFH